MKRLMDDGAAAIDVDAMANIAFTGISMRHAPREKRFALGERPILTPGELE